MRRLAGCALDEVDVVRLHLVRHGETRHNVEHRIQGDVLDDGLNETGRAQAEALARHYEREHLRGLRIAAVYSSSLRRSYETASAIARAVDAPEPVALPGVREISWGRHSGRLSEGPVKADMDRILSAWDAGDLTAHAPEGETPGDAWTRASKDLEPILARHALDDVVLVGHGRINKIILSALVHGHLAHMDSFPQANASITIVEGGPVWKVARLNVVDHLEGLRTLDERHS